MAVTGDVRLNPTDLQPCAVALIQGWADGPECSAAGTSMLSKMLIVYYSHSATA